MLLRSIFIIILFLATECSMAINQKIIYGYVEKVTLVAKNLTLSAKLDTGAKSASLNAIDIQEVEQLGKTYLKFKVPNKHGQTVEFLCEYLGKVKIKVRTGENTNLPHFGTAIKRPIVLIEMQIGEQKRTIPVNLTNRKRFNYPLLLGRDAIIAFDGLVDPQQVFMIKGEKLKKK